MAKQAKDGLTLEVVTSVICDDVRREDNGKFILVGVYNDVVVFREFPATSPLTLWMLCRPDRAGEAEYEFKIVRNGKKELAKAAGLVTANEVEGLVAFAMATPPLHFQEECELDFRIRPKGKGRWKSIKKVKISQGEFA